MVEEEEEEGWGWEEVEERKEREEHCMHVGATSGAVAGSNAAAYVVLV